MRRAPLSLLARLSPAGLAAALALVPACTNEIQSGGPAGSFPVAVLACPDHVAANAPFDVDGSASTFDDAPGATAELKLAPGGDSVPDLSGQFTAPAGIATVSLSITDAKGNVAAARCRVVVDAPADDGGDNGGGDPVVDPVDDPGTNPDDGGGDPGVDPVTSPGAPVDLTGTFALVAFDNPELTDGALDPSRQCARAPMLARVSIAQTGNHVDMTLHTCHVTMPSVQVFLFGVSDSSAPDRAIEQMGDLTASFDLDDASVGATFAPTMDRLGVPLIGGALLPNPFGSLPTDPSDPAVDDPDGDQQPGITLDTSYGPQLVVLRRTIRAFSGIIESSDAIDGGAPGSFQVDGESSLLSPAAFLVPSSRSRPSTFRMSRIADDATCDDIRAQADALESAAIAPAWPGGCASF